MGAYRRSAKVDATDPKAVARARALIRRLYNWHSNQRRTPLRQTRKNVRFRELETVFAYCWGALELPDDDAGRIDLHIAACHLWHLGKDYPVPAIEAWASLWAPWCGRDELSALIRRVEVNPRKWKADELAHALGVFLTFAVREALKLTTIGSVDVDKVGRKQRRAERSKARSTDRRRKGGAVARAEYEANSESRTKPWEAEGISKRTYYRRKARETQVGTSPDAAIRGDMLVSSHLCHVESHRSQPWLALGISRSTYYRRRSGAGLEAAPQP